MTIFTNVPDNVLEPGDPIRSVDVIAIKENTIFNYEGLTNATLNVQTFTTSGTWTKPAGLDPLTDSVVVLVIGGGGGGGAARTISNSAGSGGGSGTIVGTLPIDFLPATVNVAVGAGGAGGSVSANNQSQAGSDGGFSAFGDIDETASNFLIGERAGSMRARGLGGIGFIVADADGGLFSIGFSESAGLEGAGEYFKRTYYLSGLGDPGRDGLARSNNIARAPVLGGGGASGRQATTVRTQNVLGGPGTPWIGKGGNGADNGTAENGGFPGGGGGGASGNAGTVTGGNGANGFVGVYCVRGFPLPKAFLRTLT